MYLYCFRTSGLLQLGRGFILMSSSFLALADTATAPSFALHPINAPISLTLTPRLESASADSTRPDTPQLPRNVPQPAPGPARSPTPVESVSNRIQLLPLEVSINGEEVGSWVLFERDGTLFAPVDAFTEWRVNRRPGAEMVVHQGQQWYALASVPGFESKRNFSNGSVALTFSPQAFASTQLTPRAIERLALSTPTLSGFVNYDISYSYFGASGGAATNNMGALLELGVSSGWGVLTSTYSGSNLLSKDPLAPKTVRRLETTLTRDLPESNLTLRLGDSSTRSSNLGRSFFFGGFQLDKNFSLTPGFISQPLPVLAGLSGGPSIVELYINDVLRQTSRVPPGPFSIDNFPQLTGSGQARVVVRDALGRETVLAQNFFSRAELLEEGLSDWSVAGGAVRQNLGAKNADYGQAFLSGLWRYGVNKQLTAEANAELGRVTQSAGLGVATALPFTILGQAGLAASNDANIGRGSKHLFGLEHTGLRQSFSLRYEGASRGYRQMGQDLNALPFKRQLSASYNYASEKFGSVGLGYARVNSYELGALTTYSASYSMRIGERSSLSLNAVHVNGLPGDSGSSTSVGVNLVVPFENQIAVASGFAYRAGQTDGFISANKGLADDTGFSWRTQAGQRSNQIYSEGSLNYQGNRSFISADVNATGSQRSVRLGAQGGLVAIDGQVFATRRVAGSYALVEVPGYADVGVGFNGRILARTNADGKALVPGLQPYAINAIRLDPAELPISAELDSIEQTAVPGNRNGVIIKFPVRTGRGALIKIVFDDDQPAPAGAELELVGDKQPFFVARRGEAFVTGLQPSNQLRLKWQDKTCNLTVVLEPAVSQDDIARVGPLKCSGVIR